MSEPVQKPGKSEQVDYTFTIVSPTYGTFAVTAPLRFKGAIDAVSWHINHTPNRMQGRDLEVRASRRGGLFGLRLHRFVWALAGNAPVKQIDHVDGRPLNNSESNLRDGTKGNSQNRPRQRNNTSGVKGVCWNCGKGGWQARIMVNNVSIHLGYFESLDDARDVRDAAAVKYHGEYAVLNVSREAA